RAIPLTNPLANCPFGDANAMVFRRSLLAVLREGIEQRAPAFQTFPEYEMYLRLLAVSTPWFLDVFTSGTTHDDENFVHRRQDLRFHRRGADIPSANIPVIAALDPTLRPLFRAAGRSYLLRIVFWQVRL